MKAAIKVENISKQYRIAHRREPDAGSLRAAFDHRLRILTRRFQRTGGDVSPHLAAELTESTSHEDFFALRDVSFAVEPGERVGVIGSNGAGKSTLLKILSRITEPTSGRITIVGRVSSLLEVGTGFHPELTGRENIFLNGAVLGMARGEIRRKFDEIVAFAEVERFIDTPVKFYSSGMYVRLAFSVSAHLDPEVLILDEVLAVGDVGFQRKCLAEMRKVSDSGRTVLFVSHSTAAIAQFCSKAIELEHGRIKAIGPAQEIVETYAARSLARSSPDGPLLVSRCVPAEPTGSDLAELVSLHAQSGNGVEAQRYALGEVIRLCMRYRVLRAGGPRLVPNFHVRTYDGSVVFVAMPPNSAVVPPQPGAATAECRIPAHLLNQGVFTVQAALSSFELGTEVHFNIPNALVIEVYDDLTDLSYRNGYKDTFPGVIRPRFDWAVEAVA